MQAGFAQVCITPASPMHLYGFPDRDAAGPSSGVTDDLFVRAAYLTHVDQEVLILSFDLLFFTRSQADRYTAAIGSILDLQPHQVLLSTTHTHSGPMLGRGSWAHAPDLEPEDAYLDQLEQATIQAARRGQKDLALYPSSAGIAPLLNFTTL